MGQVYKYCKYLGKVVPIEEAHEREAIEKKASSLYIQDEMPATKHPLDGKYYTSKAKFREVTRAAGYTEVGDAYERGYDPEKEKEKESNAKIHEIISEEFRERLNR